jgi:FkbM family methyltransferase
VRQAVVSLLRALLGARTVETLRAAKLRVRQRLGLAFSHPLQVVRRLEFHGDADYGGWMICPDGVDARSVVYDVGVGEDLSFAESLVRRYGLRVWAFDPTPKSVRWFAGRAHSPEIVFRPWGIAAVDGKATLHFPDRTGDVSGSLVNDRTHRGVTVLVQVKRVASLMAAFGHSKVDILKLDIEGAEYPVLRDILESRLHIDQILVEFHPSVGVARFEQARAAIRALNDHRYRLFSTRNGTDYSFIRTDATNDGASLSMA